MDKTLKTSDEVKAYVNDRINELDGKLSTMAGAMEAATTSIESNDTKQPWFLGLTIAGMHLFMAARVVGNLERSLRSYIDELSVSDDIDDKEHFLCYLDSVSAMSKLQDEVRSKCMRMLDKCSGDDNSVSRYLVVAAMNRCLEHLQEIVEGYKKEKHSNGQQTQTTA